MRTLLIAAGILVIAVGIGLVEYLIFPQRVAELQVAEVQNPENSENTDTFESPVSQISEKNFEISRIPGVYRMHNDEVEHLFGTIGFTPEDNVVILKSDFAEESNRDIILVSIFEIFPTSETTVSKAFSYIQNKFERKFENTLESGINRTDEFGIFSFYFNSEKNPEKVFLLGITKDRIIGFEYLKKNHEKLLPLIEHLMPAS